MKKITASHKMLYVALFVYVIIALLGIYSVISCINKEQYENISSLIIGLFSYGTVCGSSIFVVYSTKASKENILEISIHRCEARLKLAELIYRDIALGRVDEKSIELVKALIERDKDDIELPTNNITPNFENLKNIVG